VIAARGIAEDFITIVSEGKEDKKHVRGCERLPDFWERQRLARDAGQFQFYSPDNHSPDSVFLLFSFLSGLREGGELRQFNRLTTLKLCRKPRWPRKFWAL
jgi:hypothetical protein